MSFDENENDIQSGLIEATLTDQQASEKPMAKDPDNWHQILLKEGFRRVSRFKNSNTGNYINVYHLTVGQPRGRNRKADPFG
jgi:hypothetical protein